LYKDKILIELVIEAGPKLRCRPVRLVLDTNADAILKVFISIR